MVRSETGVSRATGFPLLVMIISFVIESSFQILADDDRTLRTVTNRTIYHL